MKSSTFETRSFPSQNSYVCRAVNPDILKIDREGMIDDVIKHGT